MALNHKTMTIELKKMCNNWAGRRREEGKRGQNPKKELTIWKKAGITVERAFWIERVRIASEAREVSVRSVFGG